MKYFIAGTDTGVGKTIATAALTTYFKAKYSSVGVVKAIQTGADRDIQYIQNKCGLTKQETFSPLQLKYPLAPLQAVQMQNGQPIDLNKLTLDINLFCKKFELSLIEGSGGLYVPINEKYFMIDLIKKLKAKVILVSRVNLGTINHTLLSLRALNKYRIPLAGIIYNTPLNVKTVDLSSKLNPKYLEQVTGIKTLAVFNYQKNISILKLAQRIDFV